MNLKINNEMEVRLKNPKTAKIIRLLEHQKGESRREVSP
jgi:hypothetical protein